MRKILLAGFIAALSVSSAVASLRPPPPEVVRGTITSVHGDTLNLIARNGGKISVTLQPGAKIAEIVPSSLAAVKPGSFVGTAAVPMPNGELRAIELQIFPEAMRGTGEGTRAWNLTPKSTMTNGTVGSLKHGEGMVGNVSGTGDLTITVNYGQGVKTVLVPQFVPVVTYAPGSMSDLTPGAHVLLFAVKAKGAPLITSRVTVGKNGLTPPM